MNKALVQISLEDIYGESGDWSDDALQAVINLLKTSKTLKQINIPWCMLKEDSVQKCLRAVETSQSQKLNLKTLHLSYNNGVAIGSCLEHNKSITELKLSGLHMSNEEENFVIHYASSLYKILRCLIHIINESHVLPWHCEVIESEIYLHLQRIVVYVLWDTLFHSISSASEVDATAAHAEQAQASIINYAISLCKLIKLTWHSIAGKSIPWCEVLATQPELYLQFQKIQILNIWDKLFHDISGTSEVSAIAFIGIRKSLRSKPHLWERVLRQTVWALMFRSRLKRITDGIQVNASLHCLEISGFIIRDDEVAIISDCIMHHKSIKELRLTDAHIDCEGATKLFRSIQVNDVIQKVDVSHNEITDDGAVAIAECLTANTTLRCLEISHNKIYDDGLSSISSSLEDNKTLEEICMSCDKISDGITTKLAVALVVNSSLRTVIIDGYSSDSYCFNKNILSAMHYNNTITALTLPRVQKWEELSTLKNDVENINLNRRRQENDELNVNFKQFYNVYENLCDYYSKL